MWHSYSLSSNLAHFDDDLPPPLPPKMIDFNEEMESPPHQSEVEFKIEETPPPLPPPYEETSLKQTLVLPCILELSPIVPSWLIVLYSEL